MDTERSVRNEPHSEGGQRIAAASASASGEKADFPPVGSRSLAGFSAGEEAVSIYLDRKTRTWYLRFWQDGQNKAVRIAKRSDRLASKKDVARSEEYKAALAQLDTGATTAQARLLIAAREAGIDTAVVNRLLLDDAANHVLLTDFVTNTYFPHIEKILRCNTVYEYKNTWSRHRLADKVAGLRVRDFRVKHGADILLEIAPNVSSRTLAHVKFLLSAIFVLPANKGLREDNPMTAVKLPRAARGSSPTYAYTLPEILAMLRLPFDPAIKAMIGVASFAGLRQSEIRGLEWTDYTCEDLRVERSIDRVSQLPNPTKTESSKAWVPVIGPLRQLLDNHKAREKSHVVGPMFIGARGRLANLDKIGRRIIVPVLKHHGAAWHGWHAFRRGIATNLFDLGIPAEVIQRILRHSAIETTRVLR
jgi:integrase